ncbi:hypothetical protein CEXT_466251 [Caerostris extrusa]|uniref:Uncharacterized protein n=1 Tax=Caerostris extrusa TaxID=172846 RepID=A0AAV4WVB2_CAEEX|nr:hypothetical protein CEXT_466251 [Caerostris extrusa]
MEIAQVEMHLIMFHVGVSRLSAPGYGTVYMKPASKPTANYTTLFYPFLISIVNNAGVLHHTLCSGLLQTSCSVEVGETRQNPKVSCRRKRCGL